MLVSAEHADRDDHEQAGAGVDAEDPGSASGLRVNAWIIAPESPSATPASRPSTVRGHPQVAHDRLVVGVGVVDERVPDGAEGDGSGCRARCSSRQTSASTPRQISRPMPRRVRVAATPAVTGSGRAGAGVRVRTMQGSLG